MVELTVMGFYTLLISGIFIKVLLALTAKRTHFHFAVTAAALIILTLPSCTSNKPATSNTRTPSAQADPEHSEPDTRASTPPRRWSRRSNPCVPRNTDQESRIDETQAYLYEMTCKAAMWLDGTVGYRADVKAAKKTHGYLATSFKYSEFGGFDSGTTFRVYTELPSAGNRLNAFIGYQPNNDEDRNRSETFALRSQFSSGADDGKWLAGLGYKIPKLDRFNTDIKIGLSGVSKPKLYINSSSRFNVYADQENVLYFRIKPFWTNRDGFGITSKVDFSRIVKRGLLLRLSHVGTVSQKTRGWGWHNGITLYQKLNEEMGLAWQLFIRGETDEPVPLYEYGAQVAFRTPVMKGKLLTELRMGYSFPQTDPDKDRNGSALVGVKVTLPFGGR